MIGALLVFLMPICGLPALYFGILARTLAKKGKMHKAKKASSRSVTLSVVGMCTLVTVIGVAFSIGLTIKYVNEKMCAAQIGTYGTARTVSDTDHTNPKPLSDITNTIIRKGDTVQFDGINNFYDRKWTDHQLTDTADFDLSKIVPSSWLKV